MFIIVIYDRYYNSVLSYDSVIRFHKKLYNIYRIEKYVLKFNDNIIFDASLEWFKRSLSARLSEYLNTDHRDVGDVMILQSTRSVRSFKNSVSITFRKCRNEYVKSMRNWSIGDTICNIGAETNSSN